MFTNAQRQVERTGRSGTPRDQYLQVSPVPGPSHYYFFCSPLIGAGAGHSPCKSVSR